MCWRFNYRSLLKTLKKGGALFSVFSLGFSGAEGAKKLDVTVFETQVLSNGTQLAGLADLLDNGTLKITIDSVFPLADASKASRKSRRRTYRRENSTYSLINLDMNINELENRLALRI